MDEAKMRAEVSAYVATRDSIFDPVAIEAAIKTLADACPTAIAAEKGLTTETAKAYESMIIEKGSAVTASPAVGKVNAGSAKPAVQLSAEETQKIAATLYQQAAARTSASNTTQITRYIIDKPAAATYMPQGLTGMISDKSWDAIQKKIKDGEYTVLADDPEGTVNGVASTTNYNELAAAFAAKTPVAVNIPALSKRPIGYWVKTPDGANEQQFTRTDMENYLTMSCSGWILAGDQTPGVKLKMITPKSKATQVGSVAEPKTILVDQNKTAAFDANLFDASRAQSAGEAKEQSCKSALKFKVKTKKMGQNGQPITRTISVSLRATFPVLERKDEYLEKFPSNNAVSQNGQVPPDADTQKNIQKAQMMRIGDMLRKASDPLQAADVVQYAAELEKFRVASNGGGDGREF